jgi:hypothetical protein
MHRCAATNGRTKSVRLGPPLADKHLPFDKKVQKGQQDRDKKVVLQRRIFDKIVTNVEGSMSTITGF